MFSLDPKVEIQETPDSTQPETSIQQDSFTILFNEPLLPPNEHGSYISFEDLQKLLHETQKERDEFWELIQGATYNSASFEYQLDKRVYKFNARPDTHGSDNTVEDMFDRLSQLDESSLTKPSLTFLKEYQSERDFRWKKNSLDICHIIPISSIGDLLARIMNLELNDWKTPLDIFYQLMRVDENPKWEGWINLLSGDKKQYKSVMKAADEMMKWFDSCAANLFPGVSVTNQEYVRDNVDYFLVKTSDGLKPTEQVETLVNFYIENFENDLGRVRIQEKFVSSSVGVGEGDHNYHDPDTLKTARDEERRLEEAAENSRRLETKKARELAKEEKLKAAEAKKKQREEDKIKKQLGNLKLDEEKKVWKEMKEVKRKEVENEKQRVKDEKTRLKELKLEEKQSKKPKEKSSPLEKPKSKKTGSPKAKTPEKEQEK